MPKGEGIVAVAMPPAGPCMWAFLLAGIKPAKFYGVTLSFLYRWLTPALLMALTRYTWRMLAVTVVSVKVVAVLTVSSSRMLRACSPSRAAAAVSGSRDAVILR